VKAEAIADRTRAVILADMRFALWISEALSVLGLQIDDPFLIESIFTPVSAYFFAHFSVAAARRA